MAFEKHQSDTYLSPPLVLNGTYNCSIWYQLQHGSQTCERNRQRRVLKLGYKKRREEQK